MQRVFVYGTLMRGRPNHGLLTSNGAIANFYGEGVTIENWPLVVATSCFIPFLLDARGSGKVSDHKVAAPSIIDHSSMFTASGNRSRPLFVQGHNVFCLCTEYV